MFVTYPDTVKERATAILTVAAKDDKADIAKPLRVTDRASSRSPSGTGPTPGASTRSPSWPDGSGCSTHSARSRKGHQYAEARD